jgi:peptidoglycan/LPS O-acetylase OafA/YrhL
MEATLAVAARLTDYLTSRCHRSSYITLISRLVLVSFGVDIFFVISDCLIIELLLRGHISKGAIDLFAFYARRVRRIFRPP